MFLFISRFKDIDQTDSQNSDTTACSGRELYHLQFSLQAASPETFGNILVSNFALNFCAIKFHAELGEVYKFQSSLSLLKALIGGV
jgi:hypothetical protein